MMLGEGPFGSASLAMMAALASHEGFLEAAQTVVERAGSGHDGIDGAGDVAPAADPTLGCTLCASQPGGKTP